ncbi:MAG: Bax inhibitor-1/YccA family protein [Acetobacter sp.]|nr:Bax inhibitor-1/YccA family protein [Acetobacter sp.]
MIEDREVASYSNAQVVDEGLRSYMLKIYNYMAGGLAITGIISYFIASNPSILRLFITPTGYSAFGWLALLAPLIMIFAFSWVINRGTLAQVQATFWGFSVLMSISLAPIFLIYTGASIARVFLITSATFGALSLYGYTTKKDLSGWRSFLMIGLIGLIIATVVNFFMQSPGLYYALSYVGIFIFAGLTAYDTQNLKNLYYQNGMNGDTADRIAISGALSLYLDFINMFLYLLRLMGDRR